MKKLITYLLFTVLMLVTTVAFSIPKLSSFPAATATVFLDFDGHTVSGTIWSATPIYCQPSGMTDPQITEAFNRVAEDFRPFNLNITTDSAVYLAAPINRRVRVIITPTNYWYTGVGGVADVGSFINSTETPAFVFSNMLGPNSPKMVGECCSHEAGHTLGLSHQAKFAGDCVTLLEEYNSGSATGGQIGWAPIMGNSYSRNFSNWNNGPIPSTCTDLQDNLSILSTSNGFTYRTDDYTETLNATATTLASSNFTMPGVITKNDDKDAFKFTLLQNSNIHVTVIPYNVGSNYIGANLDVKLELFNAAGTLIKAYDPAAEMSVTVDTTLNAGLYYWRIDGTGNANIGEYGSLGSYTFSGVGAALPIHDVQLNGNVDGKGIHNLSWKIIADEPIKTIEVETSINNSPFASIASLAGSNLKFGYNPYQNNTILYRLKVVSILNQTVYSNTIALKNGTATDKIFTVATLVQNEIKVNATENYQYKLSDINGRQIAIGSATKGINNININNQAKGMYVLQLFANSTTTTERIIKQ